MSLHQLAVVAITSDRSLRCTEAHRDNVPKVMVDGVLNGVIEDVAAVIGSNDQVDCRARSDGMSPLDVKAGFLCP